MKYIFPLLIGVLGFLSFTTFIFAQSPKESTTPQQEYFQAQVISISKEGTKDFDGTKSIYQNLKVKLLQGPNKGQTISMENGGAVEITAKQKVIPGELVVLTKISAGDGLACQYFITDKYRLNFLPGIIVAFVFFVLLIAGKKGLGSLLGLTISLLIISLWIVPQILRGQDPLWVSLIGSSVILFLTTYLAHGISKQTTIALVSTFISLIFTALLAVLTVNLTKLAGLGNEDAASLQLSSATQIINLQGLLLGGIIIGTLGALNDVTTTQAATIFEIAKDNPLIDFSKLVKKGFLIGREHIVSIVNTLVLAYAGSSLVIIIFFVLNPNQQPFWVILNSETIFDEIVRTLVGSLGLISAVPLVTFLASWYVSNLSHSN